MDEAVEFTADMSPVVRPEGIDDQAGGETSEGGREDLRSPMTGSETADDEEDQSDGDQQGRADVGVDG